MLLKLSKKKGKEKRRGHVKERARAIRKEQSLEEGMERFRIEVGHKHSVKIKDIVGAIVNESGLERQYIGRVYIYDEYSKIDLPGGMPKDVFKDLKKVRVSGQQLKITFINKDQKSRYTATHSKDINIAKEKSKNTNNRRNISNK